MKRAIAAKRTGKGHGEPGTSVPQRDLPGALAEQFYAKARGCYWGGGDEAWGEGDVAGFEVRGTFHLDGHLICYENDPDEREIYLVVIDRENRRFRVAGHKQAGKCKRKWWYKTVETHPYLLRPGSKPQYWVPQGKELGQEESTSGGLAEAFIADGFEQD